ncbi:hypothetical protein [Streptococcus lutetiensis]|uniref:hypothetical protein n=1 Tax=Streptococcus lutetiensis TaxID=150055 RepID=UPI001BDA820D|nr:hypothetical protein [Streptococcus lutetiensis]MBT0933435.1 hypothetical protein [Streptococcus lutetiensis]MBT0942482.1 hypothetical protein [Streptococcus lutetiensis]
MNDYTPVVSLPMAVSRSLFGVGVIADTRSLCRSLLALLVTVHYDFMPTFANIKTKEPYQYSKALVFVVCVNLLINIIS